jgi:hypothetical protein
LVIGFKEGSAFYARADAIGLKNRYLSFFSLSLIESNCAEWKILLFQYCGGYFSVFLVIFD